MLNHLDLPHSLVLSEFFFWNAGMHTVFY
jgi:hypothetical protein